MITRLINYDFLLNAILVQFSSVQFSSVQLKMVSKRSGKPLCNPPASQTCPQCCLWNSSNVGLIDNVMSAANLGWLLRQLDNLGSMTVMSAANIGWLLRQ